MTSLRAEHPSYGIVIVKPQAEMPTHTAHKIRPGKEYMAAAHASSESDWGQLHMNIHAVHAPSRNSHRPTGFESPFR